MNDIEARHKVDWQMCLMSYIDGCRSIGHINCSIMSPVNIQTQSDGY